MLLRVPSRTRIPTLVVAGALTFLLSCEPSNGGSPVGASGTPSRILGGTSPEGLDDGPQSGLFVFRPQPPREPGPPPVRMPPGPTPGPVPETPTSAAFRRIAGTASGGIRSAARASDVPRAIGDVVDRLASVPSLDLAFVVDTTGSMVDDLEAVRTRLGTILDKAFARPGATRVGVVYYRDRGDDYVTRIAQAFTSERDAIARAIASARPAGGGDGPEHVYGGLLTAMNGLSWEGGARKVVILVGDAPPKEDYPGERLADMQARARALGVSIEVIIVGL